MPETRRFMTSDNPDCRVTSFDPPSRLTEPLVVKGATISPEAQHAGLLEIARRLQAVRDSLNAIQKHKKQE